MMQDKENQELTVSINAEKQEQEAIEQTLREALERNKEEKQKPQTEKKDDDEVQNE